MIRVSDPAVNMRPPGVPPIGWMTARYPDPMSERDAELDAIVAQLEAAGLVEQYVNEDGNPRCAHREGRADRAVDGAGRR